MNGDRLNLILYLREFDNFIFRFFFVKAREDDIVSYVYLCIFGERYRQVRKECIYGFICNFGDLCQRNRPFDLN